MCGGTSRVLPPRSCAWGLSPRVRGNHAPIALRIISSGSIPACAGEPAAPSRIEIPPKVYPRVCGGTITWTLITAIVKGLSPRVRGNPTSTGACRIFRGSIPACAGEPAGFPRPRNSRWVYPRVCGGTPRCATAQDTYQGLSPRVRGNQSVRRLRLVCRGSIPACAGEPPHSPPPAARMGVYPRVCGGTDHRIIVFPRCRGLSPRVRGNRWSAMPKETKSGSIPACAGEPPAPAGLLGVDGVYPRVCGGTH